MSVTITIDSPKNGVSLPVGTTNFLATGSYAAGPGALAAGVTPINAWTSFGTAAPMAAMRNNPPTTVGAAWEFQCGVPAGVGSNPFFLVVQVFGPAPVTHFIQLSVAVAVPPPAAPSGR